MLIVINRSVRCVAIVTSESRSRPSAALNPTHIRYPAVTRSHARSPLVVMDPDANEKEIESTSTLDAHRRGRRRRCGRAREKTRGDRVAMSSRRRGLAVSSRTASGARDAAIRRGARVRSIRALVCACACVRGLTTCVCAPRRVRVFRLNSLEDAQGACSRVCRGIRAC